MRDMGLGVVLLAASMAACSGRAGTVRVTAYGEAFIEDGIPAEDVDDGWAVSFERFEVFVRDVRVAGANVDVRSSVDVAEASSGAGHELGSAVVAEGSYLSSSFVIDRLEVEGSGVLGAEAKSFEWVLDAPTAYEDCDARTWVPEGGVGTFQITIHADHLFYDSLVAEQPRVLFQPFADADANDDDVLAPAELAATDIGSYDPGSEGGVDDLWGWLLAATRSVGHADGEGHCEATPIEAD